MKATNALPFLFTILIFACFVEERDIGPQDHYSSSSVVIHSSSSQAIDVLLDPLEYQEQSYKVVKMGSQTWTTQNLNAIPESGDWWCYGGKNFPEYCREYGKLYDWKAAMSVCPDGWKLPSKDDYEVLSDWDIEKLKASSVWDVVYGGMKYEDESRYYAFKDIMGYWWTSSEYGDRAYYFTLEKGGIKMNKSDQKKTYGFSVRCIKK